MAGSSDIKITLPKISDKESWIAARFQLRNWMRLHGCLAFVDTPVDVKLEQTEEYANQNSRIFGVIAAQCEGSALTIALAATEGDGRSLFHTFDRT